MKKVDTTNCVAHLLVCVNQRHDSSMPCCSDGQGHEVYEILRRWLEEHRLLTRLWITRTDCMGWCHIDGTTIAIYPEGAWYRAVTPEDCQLFIDRHLRSFLEQE